jgi:hypothetical protein
MLDAREPVFKEFLLEWAKTLPVMIHKGIWKAGESYIPGNAVTLRDLWLCVRETQDQPGTSDAWTMILRRGRDGKDGKDGKVR